MADIVEQWTAAHPEAAADIMIELHRGAMRSSNITKGMDSVSEPTIYSTLKELTEQGLIERIERSRRNVIYNLTEKGRKFVEEEHFKARETLMSAVRNLPGQDEIIADVLLEDILEKLPRGWQAPEKRNVLKNALLEEIHGIEHRMVNLANIAATG